MIILAAAPRAVGTGAARPAAVPGVAGGQKRGRRAAMVADPVSMRALALIASGLAWCALLLLPADTGAICAGGALRFGWPPGEVPHALLMGALMGPAMMLPCADFAEAADAPVADFIKLFGAAVATMALVGVACGLLPAGMAAAGLVDAAGNLPTPARAGLALLALSFAAAANGPAKRRGAWRARHAVIGAAVRPMLLPAVAMAAAQCAIGPMNLCAMAALTLAMSGLAAARRFWGKPRLRGHAKVAACLLS